MVQGFDRCDLLLQLQGHLVDLCAVHVEMVDLVSSYLFLDAQFLVSHYLVVMSCVSGNKLIDHKLLKCHNVNDVKLSLEAIEDHDAELVCNTAVAITL